MVIEMSANYMDIYAEIELKLKRNLLKTNI